MTNLEKLRAAAKRGNAQAQHDLATAYDFGDGVVIDEYKAEYWYRKAEQPRDYVAEKQRKVARRHRKAAKRGNATAQYKLGIAHAYGEGVSEDWGKAVHWWRKAAEQGHVKAQYYLSMAHDYGEDVDEHEAARWRLNAAEQGLSDAQESLGCWDDAYDGDPDAQYNLGVLYENAADQRKAVHWYRNAAKQGHVEAQNNLGLAYYYDEGIAKSVRKAIYWFHKAANQGNSAAQYMMGYLYDNGKGVAIDKYEAFREIEERSSPCRNPASTTAEITAPARLGQTDIKLANNAVKNTQDKDVLDHEIVIDKFAVLDLETTGVDKTTCQIVEIGVIKIDMPGVNNMGEEKFPHFQSLCKIKGKMPYHAEKVHKITKRETEKNGISVFDALSQLFDYIDGRVLVIYNSPYDTGVIRATAAREKIAVPDSFRAICALKSARQAFTLNNYKQSTVAGAVGVSTTGAHRALKDCQMTVKIFLESMKVLNRIDSQGRIDISYL